MQVSSCISQVWNLTLTMLGTADSPSLHAKAAESHGLVQFVHYFFEQHMDSFTTNLKTDLARKGKFILEAARAAMKLDVVFSSESRKLPREEVQKALGFYSRFLSFYSKAGGPLVPKTHFMAHLIQRALFKGNPKKYSTYRDESFNGMIAKIARSCHRKTWSNVIHWKRQSLRTKNHSKIRKSKIFEKKNMLLPIAFHQVHFEKTLGYSWETEFT